MSNVSDWFNGLNSKNKNLLIMAAIVVVLYIIHRIYFYPGSTAVQQIQLNEYKNNMTAEERQAFEQQQQEDRAKDIAASYATAKEKGDVELMFTIKLAEAHLAYTKGDPEGTIKAFKDALDHAEAAGKVNEIVPIINEIGSQHLRLGELNQAKEYFQKAFDIHQANNNKAGLAKSHHNLGQVSYLMGDFVSANKHYDEAIILHKALDDHIGVAASYEGLARMYARGEEFDHAAEFQVLAMNQYIIKDHKPGILMSYVALGSIYEALNDAETSCRSWKEALGMVRDGSIKVPGSRHQLEKVINDKLAADFCSKSSGSGFGRIE